MDRFWQRNSDKLFFAISFLVVVALSGKIFLLKRELSGIESQIQRTGEENKIILEELNDYRTQYGIEGQKVSFQSLQKTDQLNAFLQNKSRYVVAILFTHLDCGTCVNRELHLWQRFYSKISDRNKLSIVAIARASNPNVMKFQVRGIFQYPLLFDSNNGDESLFSNLDVPQGRPMVLCIDRENQRILYAHIGNLENQERSENFLRKVQLFLDVPLIDLNAD
jgi:hypothetical protein